MAADSRSPGAAFGLSLLGLRIAALRFSSIGGLHSPTVASLKSWVLSCCRHLHGWATSSPSRGRRISDLDHSIVTAGSQSCHLQAYFSPHGCGYCSRLTCMVNESNRSNQSLEPTSVKRRTRGPPLAAVKSTFDFMKQLSMFAALVTASGGSARSR